MRRTLLERAAHAAYKAWNSDDFREVASASADPEIEVHLGQGSDLPVGMDEVYHGPDGYSRSMADWVGAWRNWRVEIEDVVEVARDRVLVTGRHIGEGLASGVEIERWGAIIYTFRRGKILRVNAYLFSDRDSVAELVRSIVEDELAAGEGATAGR